jgi:FkbM family methyltransferase
MITTAMLTQGWFGRAVCFEPLPGNLRLQRINIAQNQLADRVTSLGLALSSQPGELALEISETNTGDNRIRLPGSPATAPGAYQEEKRAEIRVPVETLDRALAKAGVAAKDVRLIWMDIQGHEEKCLEGAANTLAAGMPVCMEFWPSASRERARRARASCGSSGATSPPPTACSMTAWCPSPWSR